jgi:hypothetical protein
MRHSLVMNLISAAFLSGVCGQVQAEEQSTAYSLSSQIEGESLDPERSKTLSDFLRLPVKKQNRSAFGTSFCKSIITQPSPSPTQVKLALALVEADITPILQFESPTVGDAKNPVIHYSIDFGLDAVTLRSSNPRYPSQANGLRIAYPRDTTQPIWFEAKDGASIVFLVPPVRDCNVQFVIACPRTYSNARVLEESKLTVSGVKYLVASKADGLFKAPTDAEGKLVAHACASSRIKLPSPSSSQNVSTDTPSASFKIQKPLDTLDLSIPYTPVSLPFIDAIEARLEFGTKDSLMRVVRSRATVEFTEIKLESPQPIRIERSDIPLSAGSCIVISERKESHY